MEKASYICHPLNKSNTKQTYSFSKTQRFKHGRRISTEAIYKLPSTLNAKACSFGFGRKATLSEKSSSPPPGTYEHKSTLNPERIPTFHSGRDESKFGNLWHKSLKNSIIPHPYAYQPFPKGNKVKGFKMGNSSSNFLDPSNDSPGPGLYTTEVANMKATGKYILSNYKNQKTACYHRPSQPFLSKKSINDSPGSKRSDGSLSPPFGSVTNVSRFKNSSGFSFSRSQRPALVNKVALKNPPSKYKQFSQFSGLNGK